MDRSQALKMVWWNFVRKLLTGLLPIVGWLAGYYVATKFLDLDFDTGFGVGLGVGAVFFVIGLFLRRFVPKPGTAAGVAGTATAASSAVADLLDD
ncbi:MAG: hypothetical protein F4Y06_10060 [Rhodospirillales bacterium]|nr:hypothetical protein [Rhodospirillales bacterium]